MRILIANFGMSDVGGVQTYLKAVAEGLVARGHELAILHDGGAVAFLNVPGQIRGLPQFEVDAKRIAPAFDRIARWAPDVCFSHNMNLLDVEGALLVRWAVVKFMHGYSGTCIGGQKRHAFPVAQPCDRRFGVACLALYGPRHCGELRPGAFVRHYRWAREQHDLLKRYRAIVVASEHMKTEFVRNGLDPLRVHVIPLFGTHDEAPDAHARQLCADDDACSIAFVGRMTGLKGGDLLVDAIAEASGRLGRTIRLLLIGDGPQRAEWERRASARQVPYTSTGWLNGDDLWAALRQATLLALPSTWPEPFGLVGLEAAALGIPAVAFDVGGIREWLRPGVNGHLVRADPPRSGAFADALVRMLSDPDELTAMGRRATTVASEMSLERHLDRLEPLLMQYRRSLAVSTRP